MTAAALDQVVVKLDFNLGTVDVHDAGTQPNLPEEIRRAVGAELTAIYLSGDPSVRDHDVERIGAAAARATGGAYRAHALMHGFRQDGTLYRLTLTLARTVP